MWSAGCIFAELLGRKVLFKGKDYVDQLHKIVGILGLPEDTSFWDENASEAVIDYIKNLRDENGERPPRNPIDFSAQFPNCSPEGIDLLKQLLHLDPHQRITADEALAHAFVSDMRDPADEIDCPVRFHFEDFEYIQDEDELRRCIIDEVRKWKGEDRNLRVPSIDRDNSMDSTASHPRRRYTGSTLSTPASASAAEAHMNAMIALQEGRDIVMQEPSAPQNTIMGSEHFVGEPEDMDEEEMKLLDSDDSITRSHGRRRLLGPSGADVQALERHLSREW